MSSCCSTGRLPGSPGPACSVHPYRPGKNPAVPAVEVARVSVIVALAFLVCLLLLHVLHLPLPAGDLAILAQGTT